MTNTLSLLAELSQNLRLLMQKLVSSGFDDTVLTAINTHIKQALQLLPEQTKPRAIAHFNNHLAATEPNLALPFSPICGPFNATAPPLSLSFNAETQVLTGHLCCSKTYEGPKNMMHGGIIAACYDQLLAMLTTCCNRPSFTANLTVFYDKPTPIEKPLCFTAWIDNIEGRKAFIKGQCCNEDGDIVTRAEGLFIYIQPV